MRSTRAYLDLIGEYDILRKGIFRVYFRCDLGQNGLGFVEDDGRIEWNAPISVLLLGRCFPQIALQMYDS